MYYPQEPKESGCIDSLVIMRVIVSMLVIPAALIVGSILFIITFFIALAENPFLGLLVLLCGVAVIGGGIAWEYKKVSKQIYKDNWRDREP
jgi:uncharacterized membrane protein AbrB (regulator of aidB expression)